MDSSLSISEDLLNTKYKDKLEPSYKVIKWHHQCTLPFLLNMDISASRKFLGSLDILNLFDHLHMTGAHS